MDELYDKKDIRIFLGLTILLLIILLILRFSLLNVEKNEISDEEIPEHFVLINSVNNYGFQSEIMYDEKTNYLYAIVRDGNNSATASGLILLVNSDNSPRLYDFNSNIDGLILIDSIYTNGIKSEIMYDPATLVMYILVRDGNNSATASGISILYNQDMTPRLYNDSENIDGLIFIETIRDGGIQSEVMYDPESLIMYVLARDGNNSATGSGFSILLNQDMTPRLYNNSENIDGLIFIETIRDGGIQSEFMYDPKTLVMYVLVRDSNNSATVSGLSVLVNSDDSLRIYDDEESITGLKLSSSVYDKGIKSEILTDLDTSIAYLLVRDGNNSASAGGLIIRAK